MKLLKLTVKNFMPYKGEQSILFPQDPSRNVLIVYGDNMRGKTSLLNAIRWGLYGKAFSRHKALIGSEKIFNSEAAMEGEGEFSVEIKFEAGKHQYDLIRIAKKKLHVARASSSNDFEEHVFLKRDGVALAGHQIEPEINLFAPEQVSRFFLFDGELLQEYEMLLEEGSATGAAIKDAIEQVLGVPALINGRDESLTLLKNAERQQNKDILKIVDMGKLADQQKFLQEKDDVKARDLEASKEQLKRIRSDKNILDDEIEALSLLSTTAMELKEKVAREKELLSSQEILRNDVLLLASTAWKDLLRPKLLLLEDELLKDLSTKTSQITQSGAIGQEIKQIESILSLSICPTCKQGVADQHKHSFEGTLSQLKVQLDGVINDRHKLSEITTKLSALRKLLDLSVIDSLRDKTKQIRSSDVELTRLENVIDKLNEDLRGKDADEVVKKRKYHDELVKRETVAIKNIEDLEAQRLKIRQQIEDLARQINANPSARNTRSTQLANIYKGIEAAFKFSIDSLRDRLKSEVERKASEAFMELTTQKDYSGLKINSNYGLTILDDQGEPVPLRSAGAEQIVALSLIDGLSRTGRSAGPVVMDTPFGRLDPKHRSNILRYLPKHASQLILLVHEGEINRKEDLAEIAHRVGAEYEINEKSLRISNIEKLS
jgi:DNA sulfur modification protein DndD